MKGLSQHNRKQRIAGGQGFAVIDSSAVSLWKQAKEIAAFIRYYNLNGEVDGYFDAFLQDWDDFAEDGNQEPSQALLYTFVQQLSHIAAQFNHRWSNYLHYYLNEVLQAEKRSAGSHKICLAFSKNSDRSIRLKKGTAFCAKENPAQYRLTDDSFISNASMENLFTVHFCKHPFILPAADLGFVTSLKVRRLSGENRRKKELFDDTSNSHTKNFGFMLTSPSLLLREGERTVCLQCVFEKNQDAEIFFQEQKERLSGIHKQSQEIIEYQILNNIFYLQISTAAGWEKIPAYTNKRDAESVLKLKFKLPEDFPSTAPCQSEIHGFSSAQPALKVYLNHDAWLYPYSWLKQLLLRKIIIQTEAKGNNNILVYNDLGQVDSSKPFAPFGINTEKGAWLCVGNYECAVKNTKHIDLHIRWGQLPSGVESGELRVENEKTLSILNSQLSIHYAGYNRPIDNNSFHVQAKYLSDYQWKNTGSFPLFESCADGSLNESSTFHAVNIAKMPQTKVSEEEYDYNIRTKTGFVNFVLTSPDIGFGEKHYRSLFADYMMLPKSKKKIAPNPPISPVIERLAMDYCAEEIIDLNGSQTDRQSAFYYLSPFGTKQVYPGCDSNSIPIIFSMDTDASLIIELKNIRAGGVLTLYFKSGEWKRVENGELRVESEGVYFHSQFSTLNSPLIKWQLGNGYRWENIPDGNIGEDKTMNLLIDGFMKIYLPETLDKSLFLDNGNIYLRAGIEKNGEHIPAIEHLYINVAEAELAKNEIDDQTVLLKTEDFVEPEDNIAGLAQTEVIASYDTCEKENDEKCQMRLSEYATHRGKAVTARDFERMTLQAFPDIAKVTCMCGQENTVQLILIPRKTKGVIKKRYRPKATSRQLLKVEEYFVGRTSAYIGSVQAINPVYEEVIMRFQVVFVEKCPLVVARSCLSQLINEYIAPWQAKNHPPEFDYHINLNTMYQLITEQEFIKSVDDFEAIVISEQGKENYTLGEYRKNKCIIKPSKPNAIFVPAREHLIRIENSDSFGIDEMTIEQNFIIS
ncbi:MAG: hypothetical protein LBR81_06450 [Prevotellaceae bacterium]|jgi:hypothetical protein|nr:hypothetical protein [Prevotellaceae bacterium]